VSDFTELVNLAAERLGGQVLWANDDFFAPKENLLKESKPVFLEGQYTDRGKWMDGWETRRRRTPGFDWCILRLGLPGILRGVIVDTSFFRGNYPEHCSLEACSVSPASSRPGVEEIEFLRSDEPGWREVLPRSPLTGDSQNRIEIRDPYRYTHLRFKIYPDGGVARLRVYGEVVPAPSLLAGESEINLAALESGARVISASDMFFGPPHNLIAPGPARNMGDGWETKRRRGPGYDWAIVQLAAEGTIARVEVDTAHFKGNFPESCSIDVCRATSTSAEVLTRVELPWKELLARTPLRADSLHSFAAELAPHEPATLLRLNIYPDGGIARLRVFGALTAAGKEFVGLRWLNALPPAQAAAELRACCGASRWVERMVHRRPFAGLQALAQTSEEVCAKFGREDWLEAFAAHPRIGEMKAAQDAGEQAARWSAAEQAGASAGLQAGSTELAAANREYEARFGHIFIVCATGKTAEEMLALLRARLQNDAETELRIAAEEQRKITRLRLEKLLAL
jgi:allantoicase